MLAFDACPVAAQTSSLLVGNRRRGRDSHRAGKAATAQILLVTCTPEQERHSCVFLYTPHPTSPHPRKC